MISIIEHADRTIKVRIGVHVSVIIREEVLAFIQSVSRDPMYITATLESREEDVLGTLINTGEEIPADSGPGNGGHSRPGERSADRRRSSGPTGCHHWTHAPSVSHGVGRGGSSFGQRTKERTGRGTPDGCIIRRCHNNLLHFVCIDVRDGLPVQPI